jgi:hypothetical protein
MYVGGADEYASGSREVNPLIVNYSKLVENLIPPPPKATGIAWDGKAGYPRVEPGYTYGRWLQDFSSHSFLL